MNYKKIIEPVISILLLPLGCIGELLIMFSPLIVFFVIVWAFENWRISLPIIIILGIVVWSIGKIIDRIDERKREKEIELERQAARDYCKNHPELARPMKHQIISFSQYIKSLGWQKYGKGFVIENDDKQPGVVIYNITKKASSIIRQSSHGVQTIESFIFPIFETISFSETGRLVNLEESDIILVTTEDFKQHIYINPKTVSKEESEKIALSLYKQAKSWCEGEGKGKDDKKQKDSRKAFLLFQEAALMGNAEAQCCLGCCYSNSYGTQVDYPKARFWYDKSLKNGCLRALRAIAISYEKGQGVPQSYQKAAEWYTKAAELGHASAQWKLGLYYEKGQGVPQSYQKAVEWYSKAAEQGHDGGQYFLGSCYSSGRGVPKSYEKAVEWYSKAAAQGLKTAQHILGIYYIYGLGVPKSYEKAVDWFIKAAEQGYAPAQYHLGNCFIKGVGIPQNHKKAIEWHTKAAEQGHEKAQQILAFCYEVGRGVSKSYEKAIEWYTKAAGQGNENAKIALFALHFCCNKDETISQSDVCGEKLVQNIAKQKHTSAEQELGSKYKGLLGALLSYNSEWEERTVKKIDTNKCYQIQKAIVISSKYGRSVCLYITGKDNLSIPLEPMADKAIGDILNVNEMELVVFEYRGDDIEQINQTIYRIRIPEKETLNLINKSEMTKEYSQEQKKIIGLTEGLHLVLAPPGCGKTRVLAERVLYAIDKGIKMGDMLCLTFTNRAAREMKERIDNRVKNKDIENLFVGNVHHFCSTLLRKNNVISQKTTIIDDEEKNVILQEIISRSLGIKIADVDEYYNFQHFLYQIDNNHPKELITRPELNRYLNDEKYVRVAKEYYSYKKKYDLVDFEDLLLYGYDYLVSHNDEKKHYLWIQIDEVQDLNRLQLAIIELVTAYDNPCVLYLGDEQQAIYSFMGAKLSTLDYLKKKCYGNIHHFHSNYRSPKYLLDVFNKYAEVNLHVDKTLLPQAQGENANLQQPKDGLLIESCERREGFGNKDYCSYDLAVNRALSYDEGRTAILTYSNVNCDKISELLAEKGIEHFKISGTDFLWTKEIKLIFSHLNVFTQPDNIMSWSRILLGIGAFKKMEEAHHFISDANNSYLRGNDLMNERRRSVIKNFIHDYPKEFVIFDTETTGLDVNKDDIVEIAAIRIRNEIIVDEFDIMLYTEKPIPTMIGGNENPLPSEYKKREKMTRKKGLLLFLDWVGDAPVFAHNANYDFQILDANLKRDCRIDNLSHKWKTVHDSLAITHIVEPNLTSYTLKDLLITFQLSGKNSHLAIDDVKATKNLIDYCYKKSCQAFILQNDFLFKHQNTINYIKSTYGDLYQHTLSILSSKIEKGEGNILASEVNYAYHFLKDKGIIKRLDKMKYLLPFLENDFIVGGTDKTLQQLLDQYMMEINTLRESDLCDSKSLRGRVNVFISTVHRAKGLEFDNVIVLDVRDGSYPNFRWNDIIKNSHNSVEIAEIRKNIQEDARKLYVAISRAKKRLCIQYPRNNTGFGQYGWFSHPAKLSPFIDCIINMFKMINSHK